MQAIVVSSFADLASNSLLPQELELCGAPHAGTRSLRFNQVLDMLLDYMALSNVPSWIY